MKYVIGKPYEGKELKNYLTKEKNNMTVKEKLLEEISCAITSVFGDVAEQEYSVGKVDKNDLTLIANKTSFYLDLD